MKNTIAILKNKNFELIFIILTTLLSVIGIASGATAFKLERYNNPSLAALPVSIFCWFLFCFSVRSPREGSTIEFEKTIEKKHGKYASIPQIWKVLITLIIGIIFLTDISMSFIILIKTFVVYSDIY